jgi:hypothetical protein
VIAARQEIDVAPFVDALGRAAREAGVDLDVVGPDTVRAHRVWLTVIVHGGLPIVGWAPLARALAGEADLVMADSRPDVARALFVPLRDPAPAARTPPPAQPR